MAAKSKSSPWSRGGGRRRAAENWGSMLFDEERLIAVVGLS
jgi:hypothetical protein